MSENSSEVPNSGITTSELVSLLREQDVRTDKKFDALRDNFKAAHVENQARLQGIEDKQETANGSLGTLKAKVAILEKERDEKTQEAVTTAIESRAVKSAMERVWVIPIPKWSWRTWSILGAICLFLGADRLFSWGRSVAHLIAWLAG